MWPARLKSLRNGFCKAWLEPAIENETLDLQLIYKFGFGGSSGLESDFVSRVRIPLETRFVPL